MVQSQGPPLSISPGLERLVGVVAGLCLMFVITLTLHRLIVVAASGLCLAVAGISALGAEHNFDGVYIASSGNDQLLLRQVAL
jgi:hypothetical protein